MPWQDALDAEVAGQIHHLKDLFLSLKDHIRSEDPSLLISDKGSTYKDLVLATRNADKTYALLHLPRPKKVIIELDRLRAGEKEISWFNPTNGTYHEESKRYDGGIHAFTPPQTDQKDWVLKIENVEN